MAAANAEAVAQELQDKLTTTTEEPAADGAPEGGKTKNQLKKEAKAAEKAAREAEKAAAQAQRGVKQAPPTEADPDDPLCAKYGDAPLVQSRLPLSGRVWAPLGALTPELAAASGPDAAADPAARTVLVRARLAAVRGKGKSAFLVLRQRTETIQAVLFADDATVSRAMVRYACAIPKESIVDVEGVLVPSLEPVASCTQSAVELKVRGVWAISRAAGALPFELADACRSADEVAAAAAHGELRATVEQNVRLDNRALDLRTPASQAIFRVQSAVCQLFRATLLATGFQEIHTPKLISGASEGGAAVFSADYMGRPACLAQSPQLYKQMAIVADFERVFEIGPVFRAENSFTHRHLCEFVGLDFEMQISEHYAEVMDVVETIFMDMFAGLKAQCAADLATIAAQYPCEPIEAKPLRLTFEEGVQILRDNGFPDVDPLGDLNTELERALGAVVKQRYGTDFFILHRFPLAVRPFYTMPCPLEPTKYSNSFDVFIRGEEIISGAQRVHDADLLTERATACGVPLESVRAYVESFRLGAPPHGGAGVGLERVVMLYCGLNNIRKTSMFPRDPKRLEP